MIQDKEEKYPAMIKVYHVSTDFILMAKAARSNLPEWSAPS
jgi:hypothetical protein